VGNALRHKLEVNDQRSLAYYYTLTTASPPPPPPFPSLLHSLLPLPDTKWFPLIQQSSEERCKLPSGFGAETGRRTVFAAFQVKICNKEFKSFQEFLKHPIKLSTKLIAETYRSTLADVVINAERIPVETSCTGIKHSLQFLRVVFKQNRLHTDVINL